MADRRNATSTTAGILEPHQFARHAQVQRVPCDSRLSRWVENHWCLRWDLPPGSRYLSSTLPHPAVTLSVEHGSPRQEVGDEPVVLTGVVTRRFDVTLTGSGWVLGVKFRPGGLASFAGMSSGDGAAALTDRTLPAVGLLPSAIIDALGAIAAGTSPVDAAAAADAALVSAAPEHPDPSYDLLLTMVGDMLADRSLLRVAQVEERHHVSRRHVERLFARYVGVSPKWVLARYRMHDVVTELDAGYAGPLAELAATYGWYDQAHFTREFVRLVGTTPGAYRAGGGR